MTGRVHLCWMARIKTRQVTLRTVTVLACNIRGQSPPESEALLVFRRSMKAANLLIFLQFGNAKKSDVCVIFCKKSWVARNWGPGAKLGEGGVMPPGRD